MNILIVDDEIVILESLKRGLKAKGFITREAADPLTAFQIIESRMDPIDMLLLDYAMPHMNGLELLQKIDRSNFHIPAIMMTGYGEKEMILAAMRCGCNGFIEKPFTLNILLNEIRRVMAQKKASAETDPMCELVPEFVHQLNNPLAIIRSNAEMALRKAEKGMPILKQLDGIMKGLDKIEDLGSSLLRLDHRRWETMELTGIHGVVAECLHNFKNLLELNEVSVIQDFSNPEPRLFINRFAIEQMLNNLIVNAVDAMEHSLQKTLTLTTRTNGESAVVVIQDTGCGIPEESISKIFSPYFSQKKNGTGLGLCVVKTIIKKHSGEIQVSSLPGKGTAFRLILPLITAKEG